MSKIIFFVELVLFIFALFCFSGFITSVFYFFHSLGNESIMIFNAVMSLFYWRLSSTCFYVIQELDKEANKKDDTEH